MSSKAFAQVLFLVTILLATLAIPNGAQAGGVCGGTYVVEQGDTLDKIAAMCGITTSAIYAANPGISGTLYTGQTLMLPSGSIIPIIPIPVTSTPIPTNNYNYYYGYNPVNYNGTYIVQYGDTFSSIAARFGVSVQNLQAANPYLWDINYLYAGQVINLPAQAPIMITPTPTQAPPISLSYGSVPPGTAYGTVNLFNKARADVYVSLQGTTRDGIDVINEYSVDGKVKDNIPAGWYTYVAWVGGQEFVGEFHLGGGLNRTITFYSSRVAVQ